MIRLLAYHSDPALKAATLASLAAHRAADQIVKGQYWRKGKGCAIGCLYHSDRHDDPALGYPEWFNWLIDAVFEGLPRVDAKLWPERLAAAVPVGADIDAIKAPFLAWLMLDPDNGVIRFAGERADVRAAIERVGELWRDGGTKAEFRAAGEAARANWAAGVIGTAAAAWDAARAAGEAGAAGAAAAAWAARAARAAAQYCAIADKIVALLKTTVVEATP